MIGAALGVAIPQIFTTGMNIAQLVGATNAREAGVRRFEEGVLEVKNLMQKNVAEQLNVSDEATKLKYRQNLAASQQLAQNVTGAGQRTTLAGIPGISTRQQAVDEADRMELQKRLEARDMAIIKQDEVLRSEQKVFGEEMAALGKGEEYAARRSQNAALSGIATGLGGLATGLVNNAPLYKENRQTKLEGRLVDSLGEDGLEGLSRNQALDAVSGGDYSNRDLKKDGAINTQQLFLKWLEDQEGEKVENPNWMPTWLR